MDVQNIQKSILNQIKTKLGNKDLVLLIADCLQQSKSNVYKKINGEIPFSAHELLLLCRTYHISIDSLIFSHQSDITFSFPFLNEKIDGPKSFLINLAQELNNASKLEDFKIYYATREIPIFYFLEFPILARFKTYSFFQTAWDFNTEMKLEFHPSDPIFAEPFDELRDKITHSYKSFNSIEFWNYNVLDTTLFQIQYFVHSGLLKNVEVINTLYEELIMMVNQMRLFCEEGKKVNSQINGELELYVNEIMHTGNVILLYDKMASQLFITLDNPNFIKSENSELTIYVKNWMERIARFSEPITGTNTKNRNHFFNHLIQLIEKARLKTISTSDFMNS